MNLKRKYNREKNVLVNSKERISYIFDNFENIIVSISGGKDSEVLAHLTLLEAKKRNRKIGLFFLDEEVVYQSTVEMVEYLMNMYPENTNRFWLQIPFNLTNSTSLEESQLMAWNQADKKRWMRKRDSKNILNQTWSHKTKIADKTKGFGFYDLIENFELSFENTAFLIGLRADESLNRYRTMVKNPGFKNIMWSTKKNKNFNFYPIFDWGFHDVWKYIGENKLKYHKYYDYCFKKGKGVNEIRVSSLTHEKSFKSIQDLPEFEPKTYEKLLKRIKGISFSQETGRDKKMFKVQKLPKNIKTWFEYKEILLENYPDKEIKEKFKKRFDKHLKNEFVYKQQCKQLVLGDYENNFPIKNTEDPILETIKFWREIL